MPDGKLRVVCVNGDEHKYPVAEVYARAIANKPASQYGNKQIPAQSTGAPGVRGRVGAQPPVAAAVAKVAAFADVDIPGTRVRKSRLQQRQERLVVQLGSQPSWTSSGGKSRPTLNS